VKYKALKRMFYVDMVIVIAQYCQYLSSHSTFWTWWRRRKYFDQFE